MVLYLKIFESDVLIKFLLKKWTFVAKKWHFIQICPKWRSNQDWRSICVDTVYVKLHSLNLSALTGPVGHTLFHIGILILLPPFSYKVVIGLIDPVGNSVELHDLKAYTYYQLDLRDRTKKILFARISFSTAGKL